jgi:hypothetical protein
MEEEILRQISKATMGQFEKLRSSGECNMLDLGCVFDVSIREGWHDLAKAASSHKNYSVILENFSYLMEHYGIMQE